MLSIAAVSSSALLPITTVATALELVLVLPEIPLKLAVEVVEDEPFESLPYKIDAY